jgi:hypothetical protein
MWGSLKQETTEIKVEKPITNKFHVHKMSASANRKFSRKTGKEETNEEEEEEEIVASEGQELDDDNDEVDDEINESDDEIDDDEEVMLEDGSSDESDLEEDPVLPVAKKWKPEKTDFTFNQVLSTSKIVATLPGKKRDLEKELDLALKKKSKTIGLSKTQEGLEVINHRKLQDALLKTTGEKVKLDDPKTLKKMLQRKTQQKRKSAKTWAERHAKVKEDERLGQETRNQNLSTKRIRGKKDFIEANRPAKEAEAEPDQNTDKNGVKRVGSARFNNKYDKTKAEKKGSGDRYEKKADPVEKKMGGKNERKGGNDKKRKSRK